MPRSERGDIVEQLARASEGPGVVARSEGDSHGLHPARARAQAYDERARERLRQITFEFIDPGARGVLASCSLF